jgi:hypothetical protein
MKQGQQLSVETMHKDNKLFSYFSILNCVKIYVVLSSKVTARNLWEHAMVSENLGRMGVYCLATYTEAAVSLSLLSPVRASN